MSEAISEMESEKADRIDRLYSLLPAIYRIRDAEQGQVLKALLRVIAEQVNIVEDDISQLYDNWFIETCQDWVVPYIGDLVGYRAVHEAGEPSAPTTSSTAARNKILIPRREVANTIANRRRKGTLPLLESLCSDVAGWPSRVVEFYTQLGWTQNLNHPHPQRGRTTSLRDNDILARIDGPFDQTAHTVDIRLSNSVRSTGGHNIGGVGLFVWRLRPYTVTNTPAFCVDGSGPQCYEFSALCHDTPLFAQPVPEREPWHIAAERNLPVQISRWAFAAHKPAYYGEGKSIQIFAPGWGSHSGGPLPLEAIVPADLSDWGYRPARNQVAVDVTLGRMVFPPSQLPKNGVRVSYVYGFSADIGGGEYDRPIIQPHASDFKRYDVGEGQPFAHPSDALRAWSADKPASAVIELHDSTVYVDRISINLGRDQSLQLRAAPRKRPIIRQLDWQFDMHDALNVFMANGSCITFDGLFFTGRAVNIRAAEGDDKPVDVCPAQVNIRHCTLVPSWGLDSDCNPRQSVRPSLELYNVRARVSIEHSIVGSIQVNEDQVRDEPIPICITDSILDATNPEHEAFGAPGRAAAHAVLTLQRCTVFGEVIVHAVDLAENCIFMNCLSVARRQRGCMRFCYVPEGCRTPRRYRCQPDLAKQSASDGVWAAERVRPVFNSMRYGQPDYAQLADLCAEEVRRGADDESEMGVFHDLFNPQREANLRTRLEEYSPAGMQADVIFVN